MKKFILFFLILSTSMLTPAAVIRGPDGRWYGNICITQAGWQQVNWQLIGSMCYSSMFRQYGTIANV